ncbi:hypothetical protein [Paracidovorax wautersii]|uniref:Integrating conjugative element membrane protein, PFL_4702 family n=1 Tax=Paracidovorax wautersii TaxID=1177982 RepID=A0A1I2HTW7_9BURK|nr:hypothetical protein [Paracidovorax wautersii]SFF31881.1 hypothetical protein SAMN04489711_1286 [Paracidovorax wautersii]
MTKAGKINNFARDAVARVLTTAMLVMSGAASAVEFTDRVNSAKAIDTKAMRDTGKNAADNFGFMIGIAAMVLGLVFFVWGIIWVAAAARSEGRKEAKPGWIMIIAGGALGGGMALFMWIVGAFTGAAG